MANLYTTGVSPTSGTVISGTEVFPGPFYVEEQRLTFQYKRVPKYIGGIDFDYSGVSLSGLEDLKFSVNPTTVLIGTVKASYEIRKDYSSYETSSYFQTQEMEYIGQASADPYGRIYGTAADASAAYDADADGKMDISAVGIAGTCITSRPYIYRRPWVEGVDQEVPLLTCTGTTYTFARDTNVVSQYTVPRGRDFDFDQQGFASDYFRFVGNIFSPGILVSQDDAIYRSAYNIGTKSGGFTYQSDSKAVDSVEVIKEVCDLVTNKQLFAIPTNLNPNNPLSPLGDQGISQFKFGGRVTFANWDAI